MSTQPAIQPATEFATITTDDLVTGEGVALDLPPASLGLRLASGLIDLVVMVVLFTTSLLVLLVATINVDQALVDAAIVAASIITFAVYPTVLETLTRGRSLGKLALGLRTVRDDAGPISFHHALVRALIGYVEIIVCSGVLAFFSMLVSSKGKRLGDFAAGTYVIRDRVALRLPPPPPMPPELAHWARNADLASLPTGLALAVRQFLGRLPALDPHSRHRVGTDLLAEVRRYVAPAPPTGAPPEMVLGAVIAERRDRDLARLRRDDEFRSRLAARD
ncbi:RDD family protein [Nocardioides bizhenqiangii]|uniref:RDD family protein n=1 Tax=Nocardioides bizhenqiangii TaxID=3095076 RepID=A0ABZ0ZUV0_9ACTN|nr:MULTISPECIES: RDD family protein [unclassified Nocardioides]MDZ5621895.1 RDD family protein [Nocardioides sp. HM23]WQQ27422.1 RDD family protein [Nocardioides sp. HM61]